MRTDRTLSRLTTALRYRDVGPAADWLCTAFGFEPRTSGAGPEGDIAFIQLTCGDHLFLLFPVGGTEIDGLMKQPDEIGGAETQSCYLVVPDIEAHHDRAHAAGAEIVSPLKPFDSGGTGYICRDIEGHVWSFGTYDPWSELPAEAVSADGKTRAHTGGKRLSTPAFIAALSGMVVLAGLGGAGMHGLLYSSPEGEKLRAEVIAGRAYVKTAKDRADEAADLANRHAAELTSERSAREALGRDAKRTQDQLSRERSAREAAERTLNQRESDGAEERRARVAAERAASLANEAVARERAQREAAERATAEARKDAVVAKTARAKADRAASQAAEKFAGERAARENAERQVQDLQDKLKQAAATSAASTEPSAKPVPKAPPVPVPAKKPAGPAASTSATPAGPQPLPGLVP